MSLSCALIWTSLVLLPLLFISLLFVSFFPAVILYLAIGVVVQKVRGAEGLDLIPNSTLWRDFPHLVKVSRTLLREEPGTPYTLGSVTKLWELMA